MASNFHPNHSSCESGCNAIHESRVRLSTLVRTLATRTTQAERREMRETYKAMYKEDLVGLKNKLRSGRSLLGGNDDEESKYLVEVCEGLFLWMIDPWERDACLAKDALEGNGNEVDFKALIEIFVGRKSSHVLMIKQAYQTRFKTQLEQHILSLEPPHPSQKILVALSSSHKAHNADVSQDIANCDAMRLYQTREANSGCINEAVVLEILSKRSIPQLKLTFASYKRIFGHSYTKQLKKMHSTPFEDMLTNLVQCVHDPPKYYAKMLRRSIQGEVTRKGSLTRLMVSRADIDMDEIKKVFRKKFGVQLTDAIREAIPEGDYRDFMLALAN